LANPALTDFNL